VRLGAVLGEAALVVPLRARDLRGAVRALCERLSDDGALEPGSAEAVADAVEGGDDAELLRISEALLLAAVRTDAVEGLTVALGVAPSPFRVDVPAERDTTMGRGLVLLLSRERVSTLQVQAVPTLLRFFRSAGRDRRLLEAEGPDDVLAIEGFHDLELHDRLLVEDAMEPLQYRIYPETPMDEVVDLMVRRELHAVPVVGESQEVLGIITGGDALAHLLPRRRAGDRPGRERQVSEAREVMSRSVLCVSEDQSLVEAANMMINKDVDQLPVVREGELIGFLTRETVLRHLFGR